MAGPTFVFETTEGVLFAVLPDAVPREDHGIAARATEQEVERGIATTDHVRDEADRYSCEMVISDTPIRSIVGNPDHESFGVAGSDRGLALERRQGPVLQRLASYEPPNGARGVELATGDIPIPASVTAFQPDADEVTRTVDNWALLRSAKSQAWVCTITTSLHTYRDMLLLSADVVLTAQDGRWTRVEAIFRQLRRVETELVEAAEPLRPRDEPQTNDGSQATDEEDPEIVSGLSQLRDALGL